MDGLAAYSVVAELAAEPHKQLSIEEGKWIEMRYRRYRRLLSTLLMFALVLGTFSFSAIDVDAAVTVKSAKTAYEKALEKEATAKSNLKKAQKELKAAGGEFLKGSRGFYEWVKANNDGWKAEDAQDALDLLDKTSFKKYLHEGTEVNMKTAVDLLPEMDQLRQGDENFKPLPPVSIRNVYMARSQVNANASLAEMKHMYSDSGYPDNSSSECLSWGYSDPFYGWYHDEKDSYNKWKAYVLKNYGVDLNNQDQVNELISSMSDAEYTKYSEKRKSFGEMGHYYNVCSGRNADKAIFGLGYTSGGWTCFCLTGDSWDSYSDAYSVEEYTDLFYEYFNAVYPEKEINACSAAYEKYWNAQDVSARKLKALKKAAKPTVKKVKRKGKKVTVTWGKKAGVTSYEISVSPKKNKTKVVATVKAKAAKKTIKLKKAKAQYVKIRSVTMVNGKKVRSGWTKVKKTK